MTISELIAALQKLQRKHGDIDVLRRDTAPGGGDFAEVLDEADIPVKTVYWYGCDETLAMLARDEKFYRKPGKAVLL